MSTAGGSSELIALAISGDRAALQQLLWDHYNRLVRHLTPKLAGNLKTLVSPYDLVQETFIQAIRDIDSCRATSDESFAAWLKTIADHRLQDTIRALHRKKRGGGLPPAQRLIGGSVSSLVQLVELVSDGRHTPSQSLARKEAVQAIQVGIAGLPEDQRQAVQLRYLEGKSIDATAAELGRTAAAVNGLVRRAKLALRGALHRSSLWLSRK